MYKFLKQMNDRGYTFIESLFQLMIMAAFVQLFVLFFLWKEPIERYYSDFSATEWQLFAVDLQLVLSDVHKVEVHAGGHGIQILNSRGIIDIEQGNAVIRQKVHGHGHIPLLTKIREVQFSLESTTVFVDVIMLDGSRKARGFTVGLYPK